MRLAKITFTVYAVLEAPDTVATLKDEDIRCILDSPLVGAARDGVRLANAGGFGQGSEGWCGVYTVDTEEMVANALSPDDVQRRLEKLAAPTHTGEEAADTRQSDRDGAAGSSISGSRPHDDELATNGGLL